MIRSPNPQEGQAAFGRLASPLFSWHEGMVGEGRKKNTYTPLGAEYRGPFPGGPRFRFVSGGRVCDFRSMESQ